MKKILVVLSVLFVSCAAADTIVPQSASPSLTPIVSGNPSPPTTEAKIDQMSEIVEGLLKEPVPEKLDQTEFLKELNRLWEGARGLVLEELDQGRRASAKGDIVWSNIHTRHAVRLFKLSELLRELSVKVERR